MFNSNIVYRNIPILVSTCSGPCCIEYPLETLYTDTNVVAANQFAYYNRELPPGRYLVQLFRTNTGNSSLYARINSNPTLATYTARNIGASFAVLAIQITNSTIYNFGVYGDGGSAEYVFKIHKYAEITDYDINSSYITPFGDMLLENGYWNFINIKNVNGVMLFRMRNIPNIGNNVTYTVTYQWKSLISGDYVNIHPASTDGYVYFNFPGVIIYRNSQTANVDYTFQFTFNNSPYRLTHLLFEQQGGYGVSSFKIKGISCQIV